MASATTWTVASGNSTLVESAMGLATSTNAAVPTSPTGTATAMETNWMPSVCAEGLAPQMWTATTFATTWTVASGNSTPVASAMGRATSTTAGVLASRTGPATATATGWTPSANVEAHAKQTRTETAVCDDVDDCVGTLDACGVCNGPGAVYECGCAPVAPWACDCEGNVYDVCGECGGAGTLGCLDEDACNYNGDACGNDGSCVYPMPGLDCDGNVLVVEGCTDGMAPNFNPAANVDDGSCMEGGCILPSACNYDEDADYYVAGACEFDSCVGCTDEAACNFDPEATLGSLAMCIYPLVFYLGCDGACLNDLDEDGICDELEIPGCTNLEAPNFNPYATDDNGTCLPPLVGGCILPFACNYDPGANFYVPGSCDFECLYGSSGSNLCTVPEACNFGEDVPCEFLSCLVLGCTLEAACNFNPDATVHDGSCEFTSCGGCMSPLACDYEASATVHTGCLDYTSCVGCMDPNAGNHDPSATISGWCSHAGCTVPEACNYDANANVSNGTCEFASCTGCMQDGACNYDPGATVAGFCDFPPAHFDCEGVHAAST